MQGVELVLLEVIAGALVLAVGWLVSRNIKHGERLAALERWEQAQNGRLAKVERAVNDGVANILAEVRRLRA